VRPMLSCSQHGLVDGKCATGSCLHSKLEVSPMLPGTCRPHRCKARMRGRQCKECKACARPVLPSSCRPLSCKACASSMPSGTCRLHLYH
jgi:hypothetical protein